MLWADIRPRHADIRPRRPQSPFELVIQRFRTFIFGFGTFVFGFSFHGGIARSQRFGIDIEQYIALFYGATLGECRGECHASVDRRNYGGATVLGFADVATARNDGSKSTLFHLLYLEVGASGLCIGKVYLIAMLVAFIVRVGLVTVVVRGVEVGFVRVIVSLVAMAAIGRVGMIMCGMAFGLVVVSVVVSTRGRVFMGHIVTMGVRIVIMPFVFVGMSMRAVLAMHVSVIVLCVLLSATE